MKKILFIPTYTYLSSPIFTNLLSELKEYETIYLDVEDQYHSERTSDQFKNQFSKSIELHMDASSVTFVAKVMKFFKMLRYINRLKHLIIKESFPVIITTGDLTFSTRVIKKYFPDIPVFIIQSALFPSNEIDRKHTQKIMYTLFNELLNVPIVRRQDYFGQEYEDTSILVWGEYFRDMMVKNENVHIVGDITFDSFPIKKDNGIKRKFLESVTTALDTTVVTICTSVLESFTEKETIDKLYKIYINLIMNYKGLFFIIKPHPRNDTKELRSIFESLQVPNCIVLNTSLHELFKYTDIHVSSFSRTAIEAVASNIPVISVNPDSKINLEDFLNNELNEKVTNSQEMYDKIDDIIKNRDNYLALGKQYIEDKLYKLDGNAAQRAATIIKKEAACQ